MVRGQAFFRCAYERPGRASDRRRRRYMEGGNHRTGGPAAGGQLNRHRMVAGLQRPRCGARGGGERAGRQCHTAHLDHRAERHHRWHGQGNSGGAGARCRSAGDRAAAKSKKYDAALAHIAGARANTCDEAMPAVRLLLEGVR